MSFFAEEYHRRAKTETLLLCDLKRELREAGAEEIGLSLALSDGGHRSLSLPFPKAESAEGRAFAAEYFHACIYNIISVLGGRGLYIAPPGDAYAAKLIAGLPEVFGESTPRGGRRGYAKCLNVADRVNAAMGLPPFKFGGEAAEKVSAPRQKQKRGDAVARAAGMTLCGMDVGGTDIKLIAARAGRICFIREYDWDPAAFTRARETTDTLELLLRAARCAIARPELRERLERETGEELCRAVEEGERTGTPPLFDGVGLSYPDVVIKNRIVGGETPKTAGMRAAADDYEREFAKLSSLGGLLQRHCTAGGRVRLANDGSIAAYTAELEAGARGGGERAGVFAHTLGTEIGTGISLNGEIPEIPLEVYNCVIATGDAGDRRYPAEDMRSTLNIYTGIPGTLQKYSGQNCAFRLAVKFLPEPLLRECEKRGFITGGERMSVPPDMRKPFLEHLMELAAYEEGARRIFTELGRCLAAVWFETEELISPETKDRVLFGRFVKREEIFDLLRLGYRQLSPGGRLIAADADICGTPLMGELAREGRYTVAQMGQAVGAAYFAAEE